MEELTAVLSCDDVLDAIGHIQRRRVLLTLMKRESRTDARSIFENPGRQHEEADVSMHHNHLPKLADYGLIDWDREHGHVTEGSNFEDVRPFLEILDSHADALPADTVTQMEAVDD